MRTLSLPVLALICAIAVAHAGAQTPPDSEATFTIRTDLVLTDVFVTYRKYSQRVSPLTAEDLLVREDGAPQQIRYFTHDTLPLSVIFLFDLTQTVHPVLKSLAAGAQTVLAHLRPQDEAAVMVFYSTTRMLQPFTHDHALLAQAIDDASKMTIPEGTFLNEDVFQATEAIGQATVPDGTSNIPSSLAQKTIGKSAPAYLHTEAEATDALLHSGASVSALIERSALSDFVIAAGLVGGSPLVNSLTHPGDVRGFAAESGGIVLDSGRENVAAQMGDMLDALRSRYTIGYVPSVSQPTGKFCRIQIALAPHFFLTRPEFKRRGLVVHTRVGYYR